MNLRILSLGLGVQSTTIALMMAHGEIAPADHAIFADTGAEPRGVYEQLQWLVSPNVGLPFPVHIVSAGSLRQELLDAAAGKRGAWGRPPVFVRNAHGQPTMVWVDDLPLFGGSAPPPRGGPRRRREAGKVRRQCTGDYKIDPIRTKTRELLGIPRGRRVPAGTAVTQIIGISLDEVERMSPAPETWITTEWPLVDLRMTRRDCMRWLERHGYPVPPKSSCTFCPLHSNAEWRRLRNEDPEAWADAVEVDQAIRNGMNGIKANEIYLHRSLRPLPEVDLSTSEDRGQANLWGNECRGLCGV